MQHADGVLVWGCFAAAGPDHYNNYPESTRNPTVGQKLLEEHVKPSAKEFQLKQTWTLWHDPTQVHQEMAENH